MIALLALAAAASLHSFDCTVEPPRTVMSEGAGVTSKVVNIGSGVANWTFSVAISDSDKETSATLNWPGDPVGIGRVVAALPVGPHDFTFVSINGGPCLFTVSACTFMSTLSEQADGSADILIQPAALATSGDRSKPFQVFMTGRCTRKNLSR
jgi:hypothetical protein